TIVNSGVHILVKDGLRVAGAVAHVDEDHRAVIAAPVRPSHQKDRLARVGGAQIPAHVRAAEVAQKIQYNRGFHIDSFQYQAAVSLAAISSWVRSNCSPVDIFLSL